MSKLIFAVTEAHEDGDAIVGRANAYRPGQEQLKLSAEQVEHYGDQGIEFELQFRVQLPPDRRHPLFAHFGYSFEVDLKPGTPPIRPEPVVVYESVKPYETL